jgi:replicative DNA helicase
LLAATKGIDVVFVDYLQFMSTKSRPGQSREQLVADDARRLKILARQLDIVIYLLVQLNDEITPEQEPLLSHLRESKGPANHADCVLLISAPDGIAHDPSAASFATTKRLIWNRKWRGSGAFNKAIQIEFRGATQQFINPTI